MREHTEPASECVVPRCQECARQRLAVLIAQAKAEERMKKREEVEAELAKDKELCGVLAWDRNTKHTPFMDLDDGDLIVASVNSYAKHCKDPVAAAESDLLGRALALLRDWERWYQSPPETGAHQRVGIWTEAHALLAETKEET